MRAKFKVHHISHHYSEGTSVGTAYAEEVSLRPVVSGDKTSENYQWSQYTPSGELRMMITNTNAFGKFVLGASYFIDFTEAE
jgi:hypothetical protein